MTLPNMSGVGRLVQDPEVRFSNSGVAVATVNLAFNSRKKDERGEWVDDRVFFVRGTAFKQLAEHVADSLTKGMEVVVSGRLVTDQWEDKQTGDKRSATALMIDSIGPSLSWATAAVTKASKDSGGSAGAAYATGGGFANGAGDGTPPF
ncbi:MULTISPECIES: single-stranded DNA-binding protein [Pseudonocardia]|uniref:Single-stranded DNA-binding protein n=2 Tax=Pseudonocardia TaxID=1847 RepID=A0A1Y2MLA3_PSEAH|nr:MULTISPECIES: single-stranded DNA-binding protein [Pseudonocardia]OSY36076.1 Single-stranded DNA-binding protein [Pseudonocardia autotrophica]TDN77557.1 single-strand DNA-binding protein [Pseudonocardia autotrophica]BBG01587.1 hypothetical protein Pdca_27960 [Pseudonocardia autotrophica]GEC25332.1 hypothetical protein PSA01_23610 [Pseudonocardia saturnea]